MHLFVVTSVVHVLEGSIFSPRDRFTQLLDTIHSINERVKNKKKYIVVIEGSFLTEKERNELCNQVDYLHYYDILSINTKINTKSMGEVSLLQSYFTSEHFNNLKNSIQTISKISGRYVLTDKFNFDKYDIEDSVIRSYSNVFDTRYYRFNIKHINHFISKLQKVKESIDITTDIEHAFFSNNIFPPERLRMVSVQETIGVTGVFAGTGHRIYD